MNTIEYFPIVDEAGNVMGKATRTECHAGTFILHPVVHLHVFNSAGNLYLQKRNMNKDIQPGKWDTSVGGHVDYGEEIEPALRREVGEELGVFELEPHFIARYTFVSDKEAELVHSYYCVSDLDITPNKSEISEGKFWTFQEIEDTLGKNVFTPNFEQEFTTLIRSMFKKINP